MTSDVPSAPEKRGDGRARRRADPEATLATGTIDATDQAVLATLRAALEHLDPVPDGLLERVTFAVALDEVWAEVAEITRMPATTAGVRGARANRQSMTFSARGMTVLVVVAPDGAGTVRLDGWVTPDTRSRVVVRMPDGQRETTVVQGRFAFDDVPGGMVQLVVHGPGGGGPLITPTLET